MRNTLQVGLDSHEMLFAQMKYVIPVISHSREMYYVLRILGTFSI